MAEQEATRLSEADSDTVVSFSWEAIERWVKAFAEKNPQLDTAWILAIQRGGFVPGAMLAHYYKTKRLIGFDLKTSVLPELDPEEDQLLIVDDIYDSGKTVTNLCEHIIKHYDSKMPVVTYTIVSKQPTCDSHYSIFIDPKIWVRFPWEM